MISPPQDNATHLLHTNHSIWARHLRDRVGKEKQFLPGGTVDQGRDFAHKKGACMVANPTALNKRGSVPHLHYLLRVSAPPR